MSEPRRRDILLANDEWKDDAACATSADPGLWFSTAGENVLSLGGRRAVFTCFRCPVQSDCLRAAMQTGEAYGIWGGVPSYMRRLERRAWRSKPEMRREIEEVLLFRARDLARVKVHKEVA